MGVHVLEEEFALQLVTIFLDFSLFYITSSLVAKQRRFFVGLATA